MNGVSRKKVGVLMFLAALGLIFGASDAAAQGCPLPAKFWGYARIGGTAAPDSTTVKATGATSGFSQSVATSGGSGLYTINLQISCPESNISAFTDGETVSWSMKAPSASSFTTATSTNSASDKATAGAQLTNHNLSIAASCSDGLMNGNETGVDCGGTCPLACFAMTASLSPASLSIQANSSGTTVLTITNTGSNILTGIAVSAPTLAGGNITISFVAPAATLASLANRQVTLNVTVAPNTTESVYSGQINVSANNVTTKQVTITVDTTTAGEVLRKVKHMTVAAAGLEGAPVCFGEPVVIKVLDKNRGVVVKNADVDVYVGDEEITFNKVAYGDTNEKGEYQFNPAKEGTYLITVEATGYRKETLTLSVKSCVIITTTVPATTTTKPVTTTTKPATTTTKPVTTTTKPPVVTTVYKPPVTTTVAPPAPPVKKTPWGTIILVAVVVIIVIALVMKGKGGTAASKGEAAPPKA